MNGRSGLMSRAWLLMVLVALMVTACDLQRPSPEATATTDLGIPTPPTDASPVPGTEASPVPGTEASPVPGTEASPVPGTEASPVPGTEASPVPGTEATAAPTEGAPAPTEPVPPTAAPAATQAPPPTQAHTPPGRSSVQMYLIALEDNGTSGPLVGCGDSAVPVTVNIEPTLGVLRAALTALFAVDSDYYGESGLYNALHQSNLQIQSLAVRNGTAVMRFTGQLVLGGACDAPRVEAQLTQTALQFSTVKRVEIYINDVPLQRVLSQQ